MPEPSDLERRVAELERQLRGEGDTPIDLRSLPLDKLQNHLEFNWQPEASKLMEPGSITSKEIGVLPGARVWLNGNFPIPTGAVTGLEYQNVIYDSDNMVAFNTTPAYAWPYGAYLQVRTPGIYVVTSEVTWQGSFAAAQRAEYLQWRNGVGGGYIVIAQHADTSVAGATWSSSISWVGALSAGNQVRAAALQTSGAGQFVVSTGGASHRETSLSIQWICSMPQIRVEQP